MERPKRRRYKDNPYTLEVKGNKHYIKFKDSTNQIQIIEVSIDVHNVFNTSELHDLKEMNEFDNHIEHSELLESTLHKRAINLNESIEEIVENKIRDEKIKIALSKLSDNQKRRIVKYFFEDKSEYEIAKEENTSQQAVHKSLIQARLKLKEILKKLNI